MELTKEKQKEVCDYELERNKRIQENMKRMMELGIFNTKSNIQKSVEPPRVQFRSLPGPRLKTPVDPADIRRSLRAQQRPVPKYAEMEEELWSAKQRCRRTETDQVGARRAASAKPRDPKNDWPDEELVLATVGAAEASALLSQGPAFVKLMLPSHIAGGYWLQAPYGIHTHLPTTSCRIVLECEGEEWEVVWLTPKKGLSGGWRGFAIDQRLACGDAVVFQKLQGLRLGVTIHRVVKFGNDRAAADAAFTSAETLMFTPVQEDTDSTIISCVKQEVETTLHHSGALLTSALDIIPKEDTVFIMPESDSSLFDEESEEESQDTCTLGLVGGTHSRWHVHSRTARGRKFGVSVFEARKRARASPEQAAQTARHLFGNSKLRLESSREMTKPLLEPHTSGVEAVAVDCTLDDKSDDSGVQFKFASVAMSVTAGWRSKEELRKEYDDIVSTPSTTKPKEQIKVSDLETTRKRKIPSQVDSHSQSKKKRTVSKTTKKQSTQILLTESFNVVQNYTKGTKKTTKGTKGSKGTKGMDDKGMKPTKTLLLSSSSSLGDFDEKIVGRRVSCYWPMENAWFQGVLEKYSFQTKEFVVRYDDGDFEDGISLPDATVRVL